MIRLLVHSVYVFRFTNPIVSELGNINTSDSLQHVDGFALIDEVPIATLPRSLWVSPGLKYKQCILAFVGLLELLQG